MRLTLLALLLAGCGAVAPPMEVAERCAAGDLTVEVERGSSAVCAQELVGLSAVRDLYQERFGHLDLTGIRVRVRATDYVPMPDGRLDVAGATWVDAIDLAANHTPGLGHELNHVRTGTGHAGWCIDFEPWQEQVLGYESRSYLGCPNPHGGTP